MYKNNLRTRLKALSTLLLALSLMLPLCPVSAAQMPDSEPIGSTEMPADAKVWSGEVAYSFSAGSGSRTDPYQISSAEELAFLAQSVNAGNDYNARYFKLTADLYLNDLSDYSDWATTPPLNEWTPIGGYVSLSIADENAYNEAVEKYQTLYLRTENGYQPTNHYIANAIYYHLATFNGHFDGGEYSVYGLYLSTDQSTVGLFGACKDAAISNISLECAYIRAVGETGALIGTLEVENTSEVQNCHVNGQISATGSSVGGLIGSFTAHTPDALFTITDATASGNIHAQNAVGGLLGRADHSGYGGNLRLESCESSAIITAESSVGGIVGRLALPSSLYSCVSDGSITAKRNVGGIAGEIESNLGYITVSECKNRSALIGENAVGGIAGLCTASPNDHTAPATDDTAGEVAIELLGSANLGDLFAVESGGGIVGQCTTLGNTKLNLIGCKNSASVSGKQQIGGIVGQLSAEGGSLTVGSAENYGAINGQTQVGGIVGDAISNAELTVYQCFSYAAITTTRSFAGGIAGKMTASEGGTLLLELSCSNGSVKADKFVGGIVGALYADASSAKASVTNCFSYALLTAAENAGGIAGAIEATNGRAAISNSIFIGSFASGCKLTGGIAAYAHAVQTDATVRIEQCYYLQSVASRPVLLYGGNGNELSEADGLSDDALKNPDQLVGLDFSTVWQPSDEENIYPTLQNVPFIWEMFRYSVSGKSATLIAYQGRSDIVVIPARLGGVSVTTIDDSAFRGSSMTEVVLPDSITTIGEFAFADCENLHTITLSSDLRTVGTSAFKNCTSLALRRSSSALTDLYTGSDNGVFASLPITQPITLHAEFYYEEGAVASPAAQISCYPGDLYLIDAPALSGYEADIGTLVGICHDTAAIKVIYRPGSYQLTVRYLFPDGSEAAKSYVATYRFGEKYNIVSPEVIGYLPANSVLEGLMEGEDIVLTVYYSVQALSDTPSRFANQSLLIILLICSSFALVCCIGYFIFRYRSNHPKRPEEESFDTLFPRRFD